MIKKEKQEEEKKEGLSDSDLISFMDKLIGLSTKPEIETVYLLAHHQRLKKSDRNKRKKSKYEVLYL